MRKSFFLMPFLLMAINQVDSQNVKEIVSFNCNYNYEGTLWLVIKAKLKDINDSVFYITDSIREDDIQSKTIVPFTYRISNDTFIGKTCYNKYGLQNCKIDSIRLYTPIKYFEDSTKAKLEDTLSILDYSLILQKADEPIIYEKQLENDLIRFLKITDNSAIIYRVIQNDSNVTVIKKVIFWQDEKFVLKETKIFFTKKKLFDKIIKYLKESDYWEMDTKTRVAIRNILIESYIGNQYYFINKNETEIKWYHKRILKCFDMLNKL